MKTWRRQGEAVVEKKTKKWLRREFKRDCYCAMAVVLKMFAPLLERGRSSH